MGYIEDKQEQARSMVGKRVSIPVHYDMWMRGAKHGVVTKVGKDGAFVYVKMDHPQVKASVKVWRVDWDYMTVHD